MSLEGTSSQHVQVKSRVAHLGCFSPATAARHVLDAYERHSTRSKDGESLSVVFENGIAGESDLEDFDTPLVDGSSQDSPLRLAISALATSRQMSRADVEKLLATTSVVTASWEAVLERTDRELAAVTSATPSARMYLARQLRLLVAEAADDNASAAYENRRSLDRTDLAREFQAFIEQVDLDALESAVRTGVCEPLDYTAEALIGDHFYEGVSTQPGHVGAGLVVPRPDVTGEAVAALMESRPVLLTGPSGVGKSAALWTIPLALKDVTWFRVRRLRPTDVTDILRLARAYRVGPQVPVGFLVDAAGTGEFQGWPELRLAAETVPGLLLIGTARNEDLLSLGGLSGCSIISVALDETAAEVIFDGLKRRQVTSAEHWREAFEQSAGLTMEYTSLLAAGERLHDVIADQLQVRLRAGRDRELDVLAIAATADRWSAAIGVESLAQACDQTPFDLRRSIGRLVDEHLLVERDGIVTGLHQLRSAAISEVLHATPPPELRSTVLRTLRSAVPSTLVRFVTNLLRAQIDQLPTVVGFVGAEADSVERVSAALRGLQLFDFWRLAGEWVSIADEHGVPESTRPVLFQFATAGLEFPDFFPDAIRAAQEDMVATTSPNSAGEAACNIGVHRLADLFLASPSANDASWLLAALKGTGVNITGEVRALLGPQAPVIHALDGADVDDLGAVLATAAAHDRDLATALVAELGGEDRMFERNGIRLAYPWITELDLRSSPDGTVGWARFLQVSDEAQGDLRQTVLGIARLLIRLLPQVDVVDVQAVFPGGEEYRVGDYSLGVTGMRRATDHSDLEVAWNRQRVAVAMTLLGESDTARLARALPLLDEAVDLTSRMGAGLVTGSRSALGNGFEERVASLHRSATTLRPPLGRPDFDDDHHDERSSGLADPLSGLITDLTGNAFRRLGDRTTYPALSAHLRDQVIGRSLAQAQQEPWHLLGIQNHPASLDRLKHVLSDLQNVVSELANDDCDIRAIGRAARAGTTARALERAADASRRALRHRRSSQEDQVRAACSASLVDASVVDVRDASESAKGFTDYLIRIDLGSLLDWLEQIDDLATHLRAIRRPLDRFLICPYRDDRPVPALALTMLDTPFPATDLHGWDDLRASGLSTELADKIESAVSALVVISGAGQLPPQQGLTPAVAGACQKAQAELEESLQYLASLPADPLISELRETIVTFARTVEAERVGAGDPTFAELVLTGSLGGLTTEEASTILGAKLCALEWQINRAALLTRLYQ